MADDEKPESISDTLQAGELPSTQWATERTYNAVREAQNQLNRLYTRYVTFRGNKVAYLRHIGVRIGSDTSIFNSVAEYGGEPWLIEIGNRAVIAAGVMFITHDGSSRVFRDMIPEGSSQYGNRFAPIRVLENSFVGLNAVVLPGVTIGPNSIVGTGSVVTKDVPPASVVAGNPARFIFTLDEYVDRYRQNMIPIESTDRDSLRQELTKRFFGESR